jgi:hypothetical protein
LLGLEEEEEEEEEDGGTGLPFSSISAGLFFLSFVL